jgi:hypothetical protein
MSLSSRIAATSGTGSIRFDPTGSAARRALQKNYGFTIKPGIVVRTGVAGYDCAVKIGQFEVPCVVLQSQSSNGFGVSDGNLPVEGSKVFVIIREGTHSVGWILGVAPNSNHLSTGKPMYQKLFSSYTNDDVMPFTQNVAYSIPYKGTDYTGRIWSNSDRFQDILPGETFNVNENNCGSIISMYDVELRGGGSFIRVSRLDDEIKMRSTNFIKWTSHQAVKEFNDGGLISSEGRDYSYQGELFGGTGKKLDHKLIRPSDIGDAEPRPRTRFWKGFLGNLFSFFVVRAKKDKKDHDTALGSAHISQAGNMMIRMAGGVSLERYDQIPVPKRVKEDWDLAGDRETEVKHEGFKPFELSKDPHAVGLLKSSQMAWEQKTMYQRFDELKKDFVTLNEEDVKKIYNDDEDPFNSKEIEMAKYTGRHAGIFIGQDGSVIIRDAWGSEIVMEGGNIHINTQGNIITTSNRNTVMMAGGSVIARGTEASEITSDEGVVRIQSSRLVSIAGGSDDSSGGVLIESIGKGSFVNAPKDGGNSSAIGGVVIRSEESGVVLSGKNTYVSGRDNILITGGPDGDTRSGSVYINGKNVITSASSSAMMMSSNSICLVSDSSAVLLSSTGSSLVAGTSAMILNDDKVPIVWAPIEEKPDFSFIKEAFDKLQTSDITKPYTWDTLKEKALFSFRKSKDIGTNKGIEPYAPNKEFTMYEPYWMVLKDLGYPLITSEPFTPIVSSVHESMAWPGSDAFENGKFMYASVNDLNIKSKDNIVVSDKRDSLKDSVTIQSKPYYSFKI